MRPFQKGNNMLLQSIKIHKSWKCRHCDLEFNTQLQFRLHQQKHSKQTWECGPCDLKFNTQLQYRLHLQKHSKQTWECKPCHLEFNTRVQLRLHIQKHSKAALKSATERQQERRSKKTTTLKEQTRSTARDGWDEKKDKYNARRRKRYDERNVDLFVEQRERGAKTFKCYDTHPRFSRKKINKYRKTIADITKKSVRDIEDAEVWGVAQLFN